MPRSVRSRFSPTSAPEPVDVISAERPQKPSGNAKSTEFRSPYLCSPCCGCRRRRRLVRSKYPAGRVQKTQRNPVAAPVLSARDRKSRPKLKSLSSF